MAILVFMSFFLPQLVLAEAARVRLDSSSYDLNISSEYIDFRHQGFSKKIKNRKCNRASVDQFRKDWNRQIASLINIDKADKLDGLIQVSIDGQNKYALRYSEPGQYLFKVPSKLKTLWLTSERLCTK